MFGLDKEFKTQVDGKPYIVIVSGITTITVKSEGKFTREFHFNERLRPSGQVNSVYGQEIMRTRFTWMDDNLGPDKKIHMTAPTLDGREVAIDMSIDTFRKDQAHNFRPAMQAISNVSNNPQFPPSLLEHLEDNKQMLGIIRGIHH